MTAMANQKRMRHHKQEKCLVKVNYRNQEAGFTEEDKVVPQEAEPVKDQH